MRKMSNTYLNRVSSSDKHFLNYHFKGRFLEFRRHHNFADLFSKLSESTFYKEINKFQ